MKKVYQTPTLHTIAFSGEGLMETSNIDVNSSAPNVTSQNNWGTQGKSESSIWDNME